MDNNSKITILIIEDEPVIRQSFIFHLEDQDFYVLSAENGLTGIEMIDREHPDLILTDLRMPEIDGMGVLRHINGNCPEIPVIVISGDNQLENAVNALRLGALDYLIKPV